MTLEEALSILKNRAAEANKKSRKRILEEFARVITNLQNRELSNVDLKSIELTLDSFDLNSTSKINKVYTQFTTYLRDKFSLTTKRYYTEIGLLFGTGMGVVLGTILQSLFDWPMSITFGITAGTVMGLLIGHELDTRAKDKGLII